ncbi:hypothetical protein K6U44_04255 [Vibrio parahaemolyticus]|uniref:hypothetical protein n=1 Tax=Vibrio parahaemolyticus TaxID=670 RepID=UPI001EEA9186|nr:hypothetical protein [Vibrio parahaemolyticus]MCG6459672.1 hypothetical protein [Vibrio parahaemolyticus]
MTKVRCWRKTTRRSLCARALRSKPERALSHQSYKTDPLKHLGFYAPDEHVPSPELTQKILLLLAHSK